MSLFPFISIENIETEVTTSELPLLKDFAIDFKTGSPIIENNTFKVVYENEALKVWVYRALKIDRFSHLMYSWDFGNEVMTLVNQGYTYQLTRVEVKRFIEEALYVHPYIKDVHIDYIDFSNSALKVNLTITSIYGEVEFNV